MDDIWTQVGIDVSGPTFTLLADGRRFTPQTMDATRRGAWRAGEVEVTLEASTAPDGSHDLVLCARGVRHVQEVCLLDGEVNPALSLLQEHVWFQQGGMQQSTALFVSDGSTGVFLCYANPFGETQIEGNRIRLSYRPAVDVDGAFRSDPLVVGRFQREGREARLDLLRGRDLVGDVAPGYAELLGPTVPTALDVGQVRAVRRAVAARVPWEPARARVAHWDWGQNLYRLDAAAPETAGHYARLTQLCAELGVEILLVAPARGEDDRSEGDAPITAEGPWQHIMWLGMGEDVGHGRWQPGDQLPAGVSDIVGDVRERQLGLVPYMNPQFLWLRRDDWRVVPQEPEEPGGYRFTCLAVPAARQWLVETALAFARSYDVRGFSFDFVFWQDCHATDHGHEPGPASRYAQWDGFRALLRSLRAELPESWLEGLIGSQPLLPWGIADLTHPHPHFADNQPQWLPAWPDLSLDRANAHYQRRTAYWFRNFSFLPSYKVPGQVGHQANRIHLATPERGWDWDGARFNLLSAIASGPSSLSLCFLPCWDVDEWEGMRVRDGAFFRQWIDFAREHEQLLAGLEDLFDEARPGAVDGTVARRDDGTGLVFLANPDHVGHEVDVPAGPGLVLRELHPEPGRLWEHRVSVEPRELAVLELVPADDIALPALFGAAGAVGDQDPAAEFALVAARGVPGTTAVVTAAQSGGRRKDIEIAFADDGITPALGPWRDDDGRQISLDELVGAVRVSTTWAPGAALPELLATLAPPVQPRGDELRNPWSDPSRLRLFPVLLDPQHATVRMWIGEQEVEIQQAYVGTVPEVREEREGFRQINNLLGHYADLTDRLDQEADLARPWQVTIELELAWAGQLRGVCIAHLPRRMTDDFTVATR